MAHSSDLEVTLKTENSRAVIEGKTSVPFKTFVMLILQRKVTALFKEWGDAPVIVNTELLTNLAGAPQDSQENHAHIVLVTFGVGILAGVFTTTIVLFGLSVVQITLQQTHLLLIIAGFVALGLLSVMLIKIQRRSKGQKLMDTMETMAKLLSRK